MADGSQSSNERGKERTSDSKSVREGLVCVRVLEGSTCSHSLQQLSLPGAKVEVRGRRCTCYSDESVGERRREEEGG